MTNIEYNKQHDSVRPGEQWFFYWKTSASLWESKILEFPEHEVIFIPLYWGFHAESPGEWDFGRIRPERDLLRLTKILTQHGRKFSWILPLTPAPYLPNGGVPAFSARTLSISVDGVHLTAFDQEQNLNKIFSYFEPRVFQAFATFLRSFNQFLTENQIKTPIWGAQFYYYESNKRISFIEDTSLAFEQGFSRYLKQNFPDGAELTDPKEEKKLKSIFLEEVGNLFKTTSESSLSSFWRGTQKIFTIGGSPQETILRSLPCGKSQLEITKDLFHHFVHDEWISSALLSPAEKKETPNWILSEHFGSKEISQRYQYESYGSDLTPEFRPYGVVDIFDEKQSGHFERTGLTGYLNKNFRWLYQNHEELVFSPSAIDLDQHKIKFFYGADLNRTTFGQILKLFMMGQRVLLDREGLSEALDQRLQVFMLENNIKNQMVNFITNTQICELGEGRLVVYDGQKLVKRTESEKFWDHIFKYFKLVQPELHMDEEVFSMWRIRSTTPHELSYLDVRRVNLYNPTSYKKTVSIKTHKHFAFMKMIDPTRANAKSTPEGVDIELMPKSKIALDFGHYEEI